MCLCQSSSDCNENFKSQDYPNYDVPILKNMVSRVGTEPFESRDFNSGKSLFKMKKQLNALTLHYF